MARTHTRMKEVAEYGKEVADILLGALSRMDDFLSTNSHLSIDWGGEQPPENLNETAEGKIDGLEFTRQELSNAIGSFASIKSLVDAGHRGNLDQIASARSGG